MSFEFNICSGVNLPKAPYQCIEEVCRPVSPKIKIKTREYLKEGRYPIIDQGSNYIGGYTNEEGVFPEDEYVIFGDHTCVVKYVDFPFAQGADGVKVLQTNQRVLSKYLYYCMDNISMEVDYSRHWSKIRKTRIPVPSLDTQKQIIAELDCFSNLIQKLEVELLLRRKQLQFFIDDVYGISQGEQSGIAERYGGKVVPLSEVGKFTRGKRFVKADSVDEGTPCIHYGELYTYYGVATEKAKSYLDPSLASKLRFANTGDVIIVAAGENDTDIGVGVVWEGKERIAVHDACYIFSHEQNPKYISYYLRSSFYHSQIKRYVADGKVCSLSSDGIGKATLPLIPLEAQNDIVEEIDLINNFCNEKDKGILREISMRKQQYDYYKRQLLSFEEE